MTDKKQSLVSIPHTQPNTSLVAKPLGSNPVLRRMTDDALEWFRKKEISAATQRFRIGEYELCAPDYRQILHWAAQYAKSTDEVIAILGRSSNGNQAAMARRDPVPVIDFRVNNGKITSLFWDFSEFAPPVAGTWLVEKELSIASLGFTAAYSFICKAWEPLSSASLDFTGPSMALPSTLPKTVKCLVCEHLGLEALDLSPVPGLTELWCGENKLTDLDLSPVPGLTVLSCINNPLNELNIRPLRKLTSLEIDEYVRLIGTPPVRIPRDCASLYFF